MQLSTLTLLIVGVLGLTTFNPNNEPDFDSSTVPKVDWEALDRLDPDALDNNLPGSGPATVLTLDSNGQVIPNMPMALPDGEDAINIVPEQR